MNYWPLTRAVGFPACAPHSKFVSFSLPFHHHGHSKFLQDLVLFSLIRFAHPSVYRPHDQLSIGSHEQLLAIWGPKQTKFIKIGLNDMSIAILGLPVDLMNVTGLVRMWESTRACRVSLSKDNVA